MNSTWYKIKLQAFLLIAALFTVSFISAQKRWIGKGRKAPFIAYPLGFYSPETRAGIGLAGTVNFSITKNDSLTPPSQVSLGLAFTQNKQMVVSLPFALYSKNRTHSLIGEFSYQDFSYYYYGTGSGNFSGEREKFTATYPTLRINYFRRIHRNWYAGARWWYENYRIQTFEDNPDLDLPTPGREGSITSGPGVVVMFDDRDNIYYSMKGRYLELVYHNQSGLTGSNFYYDRYRFDYRQFISLNTRQCLALQAFGDFIRGDVPFNQMPGIGAGKRGRGFYEGRFRDKNIILFQGELRNKLNDRWATAAFFSYALLSHEFGHISLSRDHLAAGLGLRYAFDPVHRTNIRLDIAFPIGGNDFIYAPDGVMKIYLAVNEAF